MEKRIAFFDFDGTITTKDTMLELVKFCKGKRQYLIGMAALFPYLAAMKFKLISNAKAKEKMLSYFFGGMSLTEFNACCCRFAGEIIPTLIRPQALQKIKEHLSANDEVVIVSASAENWISDWCNKTGVQYIATRLEVLDEKITGRLYGLNCNGAEKVNRIKLAFDASNYQTIYCYGDTTGDKEMLAFGTESFFRHFH